MPSTLKIKTRDTLVHFPFIFDTIKNLQFRLHPNAEHTFLLNSLSTFEKPCVMQIGANDGIRNDPLRAPLIASKAYAVLLEPNPHAFQDLQRSYSYYIKSGRPISLINAACSPDSKEQLTFYRISESARKILTRSQQRDLDRKTTTSPERLKKYIEKIGLSYNDSLIKTFDAPCYSLPRLLADHPGTNVLVIDAEGLDWHILDSIDPNGSAPSILFWEKGNPDQKLRTCVEYKLKSMGYLLKDFGKNIGGYNATK